MEFFREWMENLSFYIIIVTVAVQLLPNNSYKKYIEFFTGLILILMLASPILKLVGIEQKFEMFFENAEYEQRVKEIERATEYLEGFSGQSE